MTVNIRDVAQYIVDYCPEKKEASRQRLMELCFLAQIFFVKDYDRSMFIGRYIAAWDGPVCNNLLPKTIEEKLHPITPPVIDGDSSRLTNEMRETVDDIITDYFHIDPAVMNYCIRSFEIFRDVRGRKDKSFLVPDDFKKVKVKELKVLFKMTR